ncbi:MAG TPA: hypothetical protein PKE00_09495, partial [Planctomycetota bacterium]|nr:hypothetical protein [Planctomycetota bacterium]
SDGTTAGSGLVKDILPGLDSAMTHASPVLGPLGDGDAVVFAADDGFHGSELFVSRGASAASTSLLADIGRGSRESRPMHIFQTSTHVFFSAQDSLTGRELYAIPLRLAEATIARRYGRGCSGTLASTPRIDISGRALLGTSFAIEARHSVVNTPAVLLPSLQRALIPLNPSCALLVDPATTIPSVTLTDARGRASLTVPLPSRTELIGLSLFFQYAIVDVNGSYPNIAFSDGFEVMVGR